MRNATVTTVLDAPERAVFEYMAEIENLPEWATEFARELRRDGEDYKIRNGLGEFFFAILHGPIKWGDRHARRTVERGDDCVSHRVVSLPDGRSAYSFTMFQSPGMSDELFEFQHESLKREFVNIQRHLNGG